MTMPGSKRKPAITEQVLMHDTSQIKEIFELVAWHGLNLSTLAKFTSLTIHLRKSVVLRVQRDTAVLIPEVGNHAPNKSTMACLKWLLFTAQIEVGKEGINKPDVAHALMQLPSKLTNFNPKKFGAVLAGSGFADTLITDDLLVCLAKHSPVGVARVLKPRFACSILSPHYKAVAGLDATANAATVLQAVTADNLVDMLHVAIGTGSAAADNIWQKVYKAVPSAQELWEHDAETLGVINYAPLDPAAPAKTQEQYKQQQLQAQAACTDLIQTCLHNHDVEMAKLLFGSVAASHMGLGADAGTLKTLLNQACERKGTATHMLEYLLTFPAAADIPLSFLRNAHRCAVLRQIVPADVVLLLSLSCAQHIPAADLCEVLPHAVSCATHVCSSCGRLQVQVAPGRPTQQRPACAHCILVHRIIKLLKSATLTSHHVKYLLKLCIDNAADYKKHFGACYQACPGLDGAPPSALFDQAHWQLLASTDVQELLTYYTSDPQEVRLNASDHIACLLGKAKTDTISNSERFDFSKVLTTVAAAVTDQDTISCLLNCRPAVHQIDPSTDTWPTVLHSIFDSSLATLPPTLLALPAVQQLPARQVAELLDAVVKSAAGCAAEAVEGLLKHPTAANLTASILSGLLRQAVESGSTKKLRILAESAAVNALAAQLTADAIQLLTQAISAHAWDVVSTLGVLPSMRHLDPTAAAQVLQLGAAHCEARIDKRKPNQLQEVMRVLHLQDRSVLDYSAMMTELIRSSCWAAVTNAAAFATAEQLAPGSLASWLQQIMEQAGDAAAWGVVDFLTDPAHTPAALDLPPESVSQLLHLAAGKGEPARPAIHSLANLPGARRLPAQLIPAMLKQNQAEPV